MDGYTIAGYANNVLTGMAQVTIQGTGKYQGVKVFKFKISSYKLSTVLDWLSGILNK